MPCCATCSWSRWWSTAGSCTATAASLGAAVGGGGSRRTNWGCSREVLVRMEREQFPVARCWPDCARRWTPTANRPRGNWRACKRLMENLDSRDNVLVRVLEPFILWTPHLALQVEDWRRALGHGGAALAARGGRDGGAVLAGQPRLRASGRPVPGVRPTGPWIEAEAIGHPLLPEDQVVRNDMRMGGDAARAGGERLQHVGQEHAAAHAGRRMRCWRRRAPRCARGGCDSRRWRWARRSG